MTRRGSASVGAVLALPLALAIWALILTLVF